MKFKLQNWFLQRVFGGERQLLIRSYFFVSVLLIAGGLITADLLEIYFRYMEGLDQIGLTQQQAAIGTALQIERFIQDVATTMKAITKSPDIRSSTKKIDYEFELKRLFFLAPAITEALVLDTDGIMRARVSRFRAVSPLQKRNLSESVAFKSSSQGKSYFGTVYFRDNDPYLTVAVPIEPFPGEICRRSSGRSQPHNCFGPCIRDQTWKCRLCLCRCEVGRARCAPPQPFALATTECG